MKKYLLSLASICLAVCASFAPAQETTNATPYSVDFSKTVGELKPLNGVNLWTNFSFKAFFDRQDLAEQCRVSTVRLHDAPWNNHGMRLVDVHQIFANLKADPSDPKNYFFEATDDYIEGILKGGAKPIYRLGTSIEHTKRKYFAKRPADYAHYAEICAGIVRHYNEGWKEGFHWNIEYWEIWNEADGGIAMWDGDWDSYCAFYCVVAKRLRQEFPNIKIGGPAICSPNIQYIERLLDYCDKENAPLDFCSWHGYTGDPAVLIDAPYNVRKALDARGYEKTEIHLNEWHYLSGEWQIMYGLKDRYDEQREMTLGPEGMNGYISAAFNDLVLTRWQDGPLDMANYYAFELETFNAFGMFDYSGKPYPTYYSFRAFGEMIADAPTRVQTTDEGGNNIALLGSIDKESGAKRLLVSIFKSERTEPIEIALTGVEPSGKVKLGTIDAQNDCAESEVEYSDGVLKLNAQPSCVYFVRF